MTPTNIFSLNSLKTDLWSKLQNSLNDFDPKDDIDFWAQTSIKRNAESALTKISKNNNFINNNLNPDPPNKGDGFRALFGLQILIGYKIRFKGTASIGTGYRFGDFGITNSLHFAAYNHGLGVGANNKNFTVDITAAVNLTVGGGQGVPLQSYSSNYNSPIPSLNTFKNSFSYGQLLTWNSNINKNSFSLDDIQRQGMIGFRLGDFNVSSNNDTKRLYFGDGGDRSWTGGISVATPLFEVGFQDFSGDYIKDAENEKELESLKKQIKKIKNSTLSKDEKKKQLDVLKKELKIYTNNNDNKNFHTQTKFQQNLNKASTYFRINNNGNNATIDFIGDAWLQNAIHKGIKDLRFDYQHKKIDIWSGKNW
ncbi:hypothetical protein [Lacinutrix salivirga]